MRSPEQITLERVREALSSLALDVENLRLPMTARLIRLAAAAVDLDLRRAEEKHAKLD